MKNNRKPPSISHDVVWFNPILQKDSGIRWKNAFPNKAPAEKHTRNISMRFNTDDFNKNRNAPARDSRLTITVLKIA
jgi:hypothetical protein